MYVCMSTFSTFRIYGHVSLPLSLHLGPPKSRSLCRYHCPCTLDLQRCTAVVLAPWTSNLAPVWCSCTLDLQPCTSVPFLHLGLPTLHTPHMACFISIMRSQILDQSVLGLPRGCPGRLYNVDANVGPAYVGVASHHPHW